MNFAKGDVVEMIGANGLGGNGIPLDQNGLEFQIHTVAPNWMIVTRGPESDPDYRYYIVRDHEIKPAGGPW